MTPFYVIPQALSAAECDGLIALCQAAPMKDAGLVRQTTAHQIRRAELSWLDDIPDASWVMERMMRLVAQANREAFGFDLSEFAESPQVARYGAEREGHFDWHADIGAGALAAKRKLTIVVQLSAPEETARWKFGPTAPSAKRRATEGLRSCFQALRCTASHR